MWGMVTDVILITNFNVTLQLSGQERSAFLIRKTDILLISGQRN